LGGILALSTYVPLVGKLEAELVATRELPLFMAHGLQDDIINYRYAVQSRVWLQQQGYTVDWHDYSMAHSVCMEELADIRHWLLGQLRQPS
jgi:phospholipase/carboxylesterase